MKQFTMRDAAGNERQVCSTKEMAYLAARGYKVISVGWL
jgi:hypothetical protein